jgi:hypothetical protein
MIAVVSLLLSTLTALGLTERWPDEDVRVFAKWINFGVFEGGVTKDQFLVVRMYYNPKNTYINMWVDKQFVDDVDKGFPEMGNGFIHKSLRTTEDVLAFMSVVAMADYTTWVSPALLGQGDIP